MAVSRSIRVLGLSGSLRKGSYNTALLRTAEGLMPDGAVLEIYSLSRLPFFSQDSEKPFPEPVLEFRTRLAEADALLIATPEYNSSISGVLKNALDWASRPPRQPLAGKPAAVIGASTGRFGTARVQMHLRQILMHTGALPLGKPEVMITHAEQAFDAEGRLTDEKAKGFLKDLLAALADWTRRVSPV
ncbi:NAD(P)H-dependent oxidoreductase [bacterium]|nr:NAD(P)H-dependent oxidoreductase [bacterium]